MPGHQAASTSAAAEAPSAPPTAHEQSPILQNARSRSNYRSTESANGGEQPAGSAPPKAQDGAAKVRQRRAEGLQAVASSGQSSQTTKTPDADEDGWLRRTLDKYGAVELENKGSTARDHLALERTFLAWLRTSLSFAGIGIAITQLFRLNTSLSEAGEGGGAPSPASRLRSMGKPLGATFLAISILVLLLGWRRYFEAQFYIIKGSFPASRGSIFLATFAAFALVLSTFTIVLVVDPSLLQSG